MGNDCSANSAGGRFTKRNEAFTCANCGLAVPPAGRTCRNHCPECLYSQHVDIYPGDRANPCGGLMQPIGYENTNHKGLMIMYRCTTCGHQARNIALLNDPAYPDNYEAILRISNPHRTLRD